MRKTLTALVAALFLIFTPLAAHAGGSDGPTPYQVRTDGIQLPAGDTFPAHGHVNVRYFDPEGWEQSAGIHFDPYNDQPGGAWIGESFLPWSALGIESGSQITWVQVHGYNAHYGEGGQKPIPVDPNVPTPGTESREEEWTETGTITQCPTEEAGYGTVTETTELWQTVEERTSTITWDPYSQSWVETWGEWTTVDGYPLHIETTEHGTRQMTDAEYAECGLPPTGAGQVVGLAAGALLLAGAGGVLVARTRRAGDRP